MNKGELDFSITLYNRFMLVDYYVDKRQVIATLGIKQVISARRELSSQQYCFDWSFAEKLQQF